MVGRQQRQPAGGDGNAVQVDFVVRHFHASDVALLKIHEVQNRVFAAAFAVDDAVPETCHSIATPNIALKSDLSRIQSHDDAALRWIGGERRFPTPFHAPFGPCARQCASKFGDGVIPSLQRFQSQSLVEVGIGVVRLQFQRLIEERQGVPGEVVAVEVHAVGERVQRLYITHKRWGVDQGSLHLGHQLRDKIALKLEHARECPVNESACPNRIGFDIHHLRGNAHPVFNLLKTSAENGVGAQ